MAQEELDMLAQAANDIYETAVRDAVAKEAEEEEKRRED
jgi:hypothetical protein